MPALIMILILAIPIGICIWEVQSPPFIKQYKNGKFAVLKRGGLGGWHCCRPDGYLRWIGNPSNVDYIAFYNTREQAEKVKTSYDPTHPTTNRLPKPTTPKPTRSVKE